jgi:hypothetical protein
MPKGASGKAPATSPQRPIPPPNKPTGLEYKEGKAKPNLMSLGKVFATNRRQARGQLVKMFTDIKLKAIEMFPELKGQIYANLKSFSVADYAIPTVKGAYSPHDKDLSISRGAIFNEHTPNGFNVNRSAKGIIAHELGHALAVIYNAKIGNKTVDDAFNAGYRAYRKQRGTERGQSFKHKDFQRLISGYAMTNKHESFAEAFCDVIMNGRKASKASRAFMDAWRN